MKIKKLKAVKPAAHIVERTLLNPYNPIIVNLIVQVVRAASS